MHAAPPVRMNLAQDPVWRAFVTLCGSAAAANATGWAVLQMQADAEIAAMAAALIAFAVGAMIWCQTRWRDAATGTLAWDGAIWRWSQGSSAPIAGEVHVRVDLGAWMLLRFLPTPPARRSVWLPLTRTAAGPLWSAWRAAVYARRPDSHLRDLVDRA